MSEDNNTKALMPPAAKREVARRNAQDHFAASQKRDTEVRKEIERQQAAASAQIAKLRAQRLAKEEADRVAAANAPPPAPKRRKAAKAR
jgi:hypothetical protein